MDIVVHKNHTNQKQGRNHLVTNTRVLLRSPQSQILVMQEVVESRKLVQPNCTKMK